MKNKKTAFSVRIKKDPSVERETSYRRNIYKKPAKICLLGDMREIGNYSAEFLNSVDELLGGVEKLPERSYYGKPVASLHALSKNNYYFVSSLFLKERDFKILTNAGFIYGDDFIWAPEWEGNEEIPVCYPSSTWADKETTYDFSKQEGPWDYRYRILLDYLPANCRSVLDCGAGNMSLQRMLPPEMQIAYYLVDYKSNYPSTIICDFNQGEFPVLKVSTSFICGLLEYIENPSGFLRNICKRCNTVLIAYNIFSDKIPMSQRRQLGWKNHMTTGDIVSIFQSNKFELLKELRVDAPETYLVFRKKALNLRG